MKGKDSKKVLNSSIVRGMVILLASMILVLLVTPAAAQPVRVWVNAPEYVEEGATFDATIDVDYITNFSMGQFDLSFESSVVDVKDVTAGSVDDTGIPISRWKLLDDNTIRVISELSGLTTVSGSGYLSKISFEVVGKEGDESVLNLSNGILICFNFTDSWITPEKIPAEWIDAEVRIVKGEPTPTPTPIPAPVQNINTSENFSSIQDAIDDPDTTDGHVIEVEDGTYYENVDVTKSLTIRSENGSANCIVQAAKANDHVLELTANYASISGFTVKGALAWGKAGIYLNASYCNVSNSNCSNNYYGIRLENSNNNSISDNNCSLNNEDGIYLSDSSNNTIYSNNCSSNNWAGIRLQNSSDNAISENNLLNNGYGIHLRNSSDNTLFNNSCSNNDYGIELYTSNNNNTISNNTCSNNLYGILLSDSNTNTISNNNCSDNYDGIGLSNSSNDIVSNNNCSSNNNIGIHLWLSSNNNAISNNTCSSNNIGIRFCESRNNKIYLNNFINNSDNVRSLRSTNIWNSTSKITYTHFGKTYTNYMGNYWDDYRGSDVDSDGIGDRPYTVYPDEDHYPLMHPWQDYFVSQPIYVPDDYPTIQQAVDNASEGDVIIVRDGTYIENVKVNKRLTIRSENGSEATTVIAENPNENVFEATADYVNINGFTVEGATGNEKAGIKVESEGNIISNNTCQNNWISIYFGNSTKNVVLKNYCDNNSVGIKLYNSSDNLVSNNRYENNRIGVELYWSNNNTISDNSFNSTVGDAIICLGYSSNNVILNNSCKYYPYLEGYNGIILFHSYENTILKNNCEGCVNGISLRDSENNAISKNSCRYNLAAGIRLDSSSNNTILYNICEYTMIHGIHLADSSSNVIMNNLCCENTNDGIGLWNSSGNIIVNNSCKSNRKGIKLWFSSSDNEVLKNYFEDNYYGAHLFNSSNNAIYLNDFVNNSKNIGFWEDSNSTNIWNSTEEITYTYKGKTYTNYLGNYWGDYRGSDADSDGIGDFPYIIDSDKDNYPLMERFENYYVKPIYVPDDYPTIQQAVDNAAEGDVIIVRDGTYIENVKVNKRLTIRSENGSEATTVIAENPNDNVFEVTSDYVNISGFTVTGASSFPLAGIYLYYSDYCNISNNNCLDNFRGIKLFYSNSTMISNNTLCENDLGGVLLKSSSNNIISNNTICKNDYGIGLVGSLNNNIISYNIIYENDPGVVNLMPTNSNNNTISYNVICKNNRGGVSVYGSSWNISSNEIWENNGAGIALVGAFNITITNNTINSNNGSGIQLGHEGISFLNNNTISGNKISSNKYDGIFLGSQSGNNTITSNTISSNNRHGIYLYRSSNNTITGNTMKNDGIFFYRHDLQYWNTHTIENNTVNGKPLYYFKNRIGGKVPEDAGQVILANCTGMIIENLSITDTDAGIVLGFSSENTVENSNASNNDYGIYLYSSSNNSIAGNTVSSNNKNGIYLWDSSHNIIYLNNFINNTENVDSYNPVNIWNSTEKITYTYNGSTFMNYLGNYWDDYHGTDADKDGLGDSPYSIDPDKDYHPLMSPFEYYFAPVENIFDTGPSKNPYPSISGTHNGTITPNQTITVSKLYTYPCEGTGGHSEYVKIWNKSGIIAEAYWEGYKGDWHNITFPESFILEADKTYNFTIRTGSYPQIHHNRTLTVPDGEITCVKFTDANGRVYYDWILAIKVSQ